MTADQMQSEIQAPFLHDITLSADPIFMDQQLKEASTLHHELKNTILLAKEFAMDKDQMGY